MHDMHHMHGPIYDTTEEFNSLTGTTKLICCELQLAHDWIPSNE